MARKKKEITVIRNYPEGEMYEKFVDMAHDLLAKAIIATNPSECVEALKRALETAIEKENNEKEIKSE